MSAPTYDRSPRDDRFNEPTAAQLRAELDGSPASLFDEARKRLAGVSGVRERVGWHGICWKWCLEYGPSAGKEPIAVLIPSPIDLQIAMPLDKDFVEGLPMQQMRRTVRDGLEMVQEPMDTRWGVWSIQTGSLIEELVDLIERKLDARRKRAG